MQGFASLFPQAAQPTELDETTAVVLRIFINMLKKPWKHRRKWSVWDFWLPLILTAPFGCAGASRHVLLLFWGKSLPLWAMRLGGVTALCKQERGSMWRLGLPKSSFQPCGMGHPV